MTFLVISVEVSCFPFKFQFTPQHWCPCSPHYSLYFPMELTRRICLTIRSFLNYWSFPLFSWPLHLTQGWYCKEKLEASHSRSWTNISSWYLLLTKGKQKNCSSFRKTNLKQSLLTFLHPFFIFIDAEFVSHSRRVCKYFQKRSLNLYTLISVYIFSILFFTCYLRCWQGEFILKPRTS